VARRVVACGARDAAVEPGQHDGPAAARQADPIHHLGDHADGSVIAPVARDQEDAVVVTDVHGQRHGHGRKNDGIVERDESETVHWTSERKSARDVVNLG
jgi:hypothetical protein